MIIPRSQWNARAARGSTRFTGTGDPAIHWNGPPTRLTQSSTEASEASFMRGTQNFHMDDRGWVDFAYNYAIAPSGRIYEGRGRRNRSAANGSTTQNVNRLAIFLMIGQGQEVTRPMVSSVNWLLNDLGHDDVVGHRDIRSTECPGDHIYSLLAQFNGQSGTETTTTTTTSGGTTVDEYQLPEFMLTRIVDGVTGQEIVKTLFQHHLGRPAEVSAESYWGERIHELHREGTGWHEAIRQINFEIYESDEAKARRS